MVDDDKQVTQKQSHKSITWDRMMSQPRMEIMDNAFGCSRATQVLMETPETVNLAEFHPRYNNKQTNLLVFTLEGHTHETKSNLKLLTTKTY